MNDKTPSQPGRIFLFISALMYFLIGVLFIINPAGAATSLGYQDLSLAALTDVMATYGGLLTSIGVLLFYQLKTLQIKAGLLLTFLTFAGFALGRSLAALRYQGFYGLHLYWLIFEIVYVLLTLYFLKKHKTSRAEE